MWAAGGPLFGWVDGWKCELMVLVTRGRFSRWSVWSVVLWWKGTAVLYATSFSPNTHFGISFEK